ncbi:relaxase/mobilization nuclease domain-containing protein [Caulobacter sp. NIBR2454]|uniref:relaxase/mobilization nuclease domain-containing protein n=1 Tax=Caulobacter sp. NIBR2454 TaxID=3015996 RepID=UPI0022B64623|nr:hypothetical protein [Caulobacter sp. NIBR2454]
MAELANVRGFEDLWRQINEPRRYTKGLFDAGSIRVELRRLVSRPPLAMVTNMARPKSHGALQNHLLYISRHGELALRGRDGERLIGRERIVERADDWALDQVRYRGGVALAYTMVLSMPPGTPAEPVEMAARSFAASEFSQNDFLTVLHLDRPHPHVHLAVRAESDDARHHPSKIADLYRWPEVFAAKLRDAGLEADGAPRWVRGVVIKPLNPKVRHAMDDYRDGRGGPIRFVAEDHREALDIARGFDVGDRPWERAIAERQRKTREGYLALADHLEAMNEAGDQDLAHDLRRFVQDMAPVRTRRELLVEQARDYDRRRALERLSDRERRIGAPERDR